MFEQRGWRRVGPVEGPVPVAPSSPSASDVLEWVERAPVTGAWLDAVRGLDPAGLGDADRLRLARAWDRLRRGVDAGFTAVLGTVRARPCVTGPDDPTCHGGPSCPHDWSSKDVSLALGVGPRTAEHLLGDSRELVGRLPRVLAEVEAGRASLTHARRAAVRTARIADAGLVEVLDETVAPLMLGRTVTAFDAVVAAEIERHRDPAEVAAAHAAAVRRETGIRPLPPLEDGLAAAVITGPADRIAALFGWARQFTTLNRDPADPRTVGQRRFDALLAGVLDPLAGLTSGGPVDVTPAGTTGSGPTGSGTDTAGTGPSGVGPMSGGPAGAGVAPDRPVVRTPVRLRLVMSLSSLLGTDNEPAWLEGHGDVSAVLARSLAVGPATIQRLLAHPLTGELLDLTPEVRTPGAGLDRYVRARDGVCGGPGCGASAETADLDHVRPVSEGGPTTRANLHAACRRDHRSRHAGGYRVRRDPDGTETWTDPHGNSYQTEPTRYPTGPPGAGGPPEGDSAPFGDFDELEGLDTGQLPRPAGDDTTEGDDDAPDCPF